MASVFALHVYKPGGDMSRCRYSIEYSIDPWVSIISCAKDRWTPWPMLLSTLLTPHTTLCLLLISLHCRVVRCTVHSATVHMVHCTRTAALLHISPDGTVLHIGHILRGTCYIYIYICCSTCTTLDQAGRWLPRYTGESLTLTFPLFNHQAGAGKHSTHAPSIEIKLIIVIIIQRVWH